MIERRLAGHHKRRREDARTVGRLIVDANQPSPRSHPGERQRAPAAKVATCAPREPPSPRAIGNGECNLGADAPRHLGEKDRAEDSRQPRVDPVTPPETEVRSRWRHQNERGGPVGTLRGESKRDEPAEGYAADRRSRQVAIVEHCVDLVDEVVQSSRRIETPATPAFAAERKGDDAE